jgi:hypothetical protein
MLLCAWRQRTREKQCGWRSVIKLMRARRTVRSRVRSMLAIPRLVGNEPQQLPTMACCANVLVALVSKSLPLLLVATRVAGRQSVRGRIDLLQAPAILQPSTLNSRNHRQRLHDGESPLVMDAPWHPSLMTCRGFSQSTVVPWRTDDHVRQKRRVGLIKPRSRGVSPDSPASLKLDVRCGWRSRYPRAAAYWAQDDFLYAGQATRGRAEEQATRALGRRTSGQATDDSARDSTRLIRTHSRAAGSQSAREKQSQGQNSAKQALIPVSRCVCCRLPNCRWRRRR